MFVIVLLLILTILLYYTFRRQYSYWSKKRIPSPEPIPIFGNVLKSMIGVKSMGEIVTDLYRKYDNYPFVGVYRGGTPCLIIRDIDFIKNITVKDFKSFQNNEFYVEKEMDPLLGRNPFVLRGEEWKKSRSQLTQCLTSGKIKSIFPLISETAKQLVEYVVNHNKLVNSTGYEAKELCAKFTLGNVAACAFGIDGKPFEDPESDFSILARKFIATESWTTFNMVLLALMPKLARFISLKVVPKEVDAGLIGLVKDNLKYREENNIVRNDIFDLIKQIIKAENLKDVDVAAHASSFLAEGYDTSAQVMGFLLFELAMNPDVQEKLREEINTSYEKNNNQFTYESIQEMHYLDACLSESLRKNPVILFFTRLCTEQYTYAPSNPDYKNITVTLEPGTPILLPVEGLHMDPKYFESPEKFMPERFLDKQTVGRYMFMPFGEGPRICLGQRFGVAQVKIGVSYLVKNFRMTVNKRTQLPLKYDPWSFVVAPKGGLWVNFNKI